MMIDPATDPLMDPPKSFRIVIPFFPPSANNIYVTDWKRRKRFKSSEAKKFENKFISEVVPKYLPWISRLKNVVEDPNSTYIVHVDFFFSRWDVENKGFFATRKSAKTRYKKMDTGNRLKLITDCFVRAIGEPFDDSQFFTISGRKLNCESFGVDPQVHLILTQSYPSDYGL